MPENASTKGAFLNVATGNRNSGGNRRSYQDKDKPAQIRFSNISAGKEVADAAARTSLGPKGMDNMVSFELVCVVCAHNKTAEHLKDVLQNALAETKHSGSSKITIPGKA